MLQGFENLLISQLHLHLGLLANMATVDPKKDDLLLKIKSFKNGLSE